MDAALRLAERGRDAVSPNPLVGAVIVRDGVVVGRGWHRRFGGPHGEIEAIRDAGDRARGADLYVTLEPCGHHGKTPPCSEAILAAGLARVFYGASDPNPLTRGKGPRLLSRRGIEVRGGVLEEAARDQNAPYFHWRATGRPWTILKWAMSADGKIATRTGSSRWISGEASRRLVHRLRRRVDAVMVGTETLCRDDPSLLPRPARGRTPVRVILDRLGRLPPSLGVLQDDGTPRVYVTSSRTPAARRRGIEANGLDVLTVPARRGRLDLERVLAALGERGVSQLLVEGGGALAASLLEAGLAQEVVVFTAPKVVGGASAPGPVGGRGVATMADALQLVDVRIRRLGDDAVITGRLLPPS